jgi:hypothetical protein
MLLAAMEGGPRHGYAVIEALRSVMVSAALEGRPCPSPA